jgi:hypothetical protein
MLKPIALAGLLGVLAAPVGFAAQGQETLVFVRHGEKPAQEIGQLDCQGLNRALALPDALARFGRPDFIFAPDPSVQIGDKGGPKQNYFRPLATILPTAIRLGLPIDIRFGYSDISGLEGELLDPKYRDALVFVAWEHKELDKLVRAIVKARGGDPGLVPKWPGDDFDSIFVVTIGPDGTPVRFRHEQEGITGLSDACPK